MGKENDRMITWTERRKQIGIKFRESTLEAIDLLDKNKFNSRTDFLERVAEDYLIKQGKLTDGRKG